jgi:hypothetical protein
VRPGVVVELDEPVQLGLQLAEAGCPGLVAQPPLQRLVEAFDLSAGLRLSG